MATIGAVRGSGAFSITKDDAVDLPKMVLETVEQSPLILVSVLETDSVNLDLSELEFIFVPIADSDMIDIEIIDGEVVTPSGGGAGVYKSYMICYTYGIGY